MTIELNNITSGYSTGLINDNFQSLEAYINDNLLNRDGVATGESNQMELSLDMNSHFIYNLPEPVLEHQAARLQDVQNAISGSDSANLVTFTPYANISAENVQGAIQELADGTGQSVLTSSGQQTLVDALEDRTLSSDFSEAGFLLGLDPTGTEDIASTLQAALDSRRVVILPPGDFKLSSKVTLNSKNVLLGSGMCSTRIFRDTSVATFDMFEAIAETDICVGNLHLDGVDKEDVTVAANRYSALRFWDGGLGTGCSGITVSNVKFSKTTSAETQTEGDRGVITLQECDNVEVGSCQFLDNRATCVYWFPASNVRVHDCYCQGEQTPYDASFGRLGSFTSGICDGAIVSDNRIEDTGFTSLNVSGAGVTITGNVIRSPELSCITIAELLPATTDLTISGNSLFSPGVDGISLYEVNRGIISSNTIHAATATARAGIQLYNTLNDNFPTNLQISSNTLIGNTNGIRMRGGQGITSQGNLLKQNSVGILMANVSSASSALTSMGDHYADNVVYAANLEGTATAAQTMSLSGATVISSNIGTTQETAFVIQDAESTLNIGSGNSFSTNYSTLFVETSFGSRATKAFLNLSATISRLKSVNEVPFGAQTSFDPPSLADGEGTNATLTVSGVAVGDIVEAVFSQPLPGGVLLLGSVTSSNTVTVRFQNESGSIQDLPSGTVTAKVRKV